MCGFNGSCGPVRVRFVVFMVVVGQSGPDVWFSV